MYSSKIMHGWVLRPTQPCKNARPTLTSATYLMRSTRPCILEKYARSGFTTNSTVHRSPFTLGPWVDNPRVRLGGLISVIGLATTAPRPASAALLVPRLPPPPPPSPHPASAPLPPSSPHQAFAPLLCAPSLLPLPPSSTASTPALLSLLPPSAPTALGWRRTSSSTMVRTTSGSTRS